MKSTKHHSLGRQLRVAIVSSMAGTYGVYLVQFGVMLIYARLFTPEQFGIVASISVFAMFFNLLSGMGLNPAIINIKKFKKSERDGLFGITCLVGLFFAICFYFLSFSLNTFYGQNIYQNLAPFFCVGILFESMNTMPRGFFLREKKFIYIAKIEIVVELISATLILMMYKQLPPIYLLSAKMAIGPIFRFALMYFFSSTTEFGRPFPRRNIGAIKPFFTFSLYHFGFELVNYISKTLDSILVAKYFGMASLGLYDKAYALMRYPQQLLSRALSPAIQPVVTNYTSDLMLVASSHMAIIRNLGFMGGLIGGLLALSSTQITLILLGDKWSGVGALFGIFALGIPFRIVNASSGGFYLALGKANYRFRVGLRSAIVNLAAILVGVWSLDLHVLAGALVISYLVNTMINFVVAGEFLYDKQVNLFPELIPGAVTMLGCLSFGFIIQNWISLGNNWLSLLVNSSAGLFGSSVALYLTGQWRKLELITKPLAKIQLSKPKSR